MVDVFLYSGEPNPNDVKLRIGTPVNGVAPGDIIIVDVSVIGGVASGEVVKKTTTGGGSVFMRTPTFPFTKLPFEKKKRAAVAEGEVVKIKVQLIPGVARGSARADGAVIVIGQEIIPGKARGRANVKGQLVEANTGLLARLDHEFLMLASRR